MASERVLSPLGVLTLHGLLLADVAAHRHHLLVFSGASVAEWLLAALAICAYLRTVICDPGQLRAEPAPQSCPGLLALLAPLGLLAPKRPARSSARDVRKASEVELEPIGRAQLEAMEEEVEDPGEEVISLEDLEGGATVDTEVGTRPPPHHAEPGGNPEFATRGAKLRFCKVCKMQQPLRTKHCRDCNMCIRTHDHHCPWVGTCIGEGNRAYFFWFLVFQWLELLVFAIEGGLELAKDGLTPPLWLARAPLLVLGMALMCMLVLMVTCLVSFHSYLALVNMTTWENISWYNISYLKSLAPNLGSPFSGSLRKNLAVYCCSKGVKHTEDGWIVWELAEQKNPLEICGDCCSCFDVDD